MDQIQSGTCFCTANKAKERFFLLLLFVLFNNGKKSKEEHSVTQDTSIKQMLTSESEVSAPHPSICVLPMAVVQNYSWDLSSCFRDLRIACKA